MRFVLIILLAATFLGCKEEDPRIKDLVLDYKKNHLPSIYKFTKGTVTNLSSSPIIKVNLRINKFSQNGFLAGTEYVRIREGLNVNQQEEFCVFLADSITRINIKVTKIE